MVYLKLKYLSPSKTLLLYSISSSNILILIIILIIIRKSYDYQKNLKMEKQMIELKYNESSQLRVRLAILESQLKISNNKLQHLKKENKEKILGTKQFQVL